MSYIQLTLTPEQQTKYPEIYKASTGCLITIGSPDHERLQNYPQDLNPEQVNQIAKIYNDKYRETETKLEKLSEELGIDYDLLYEDLENNHMGYTILEYAYHAGLTNK